MKLEVLKKYQESIEMLQADIKEKDESCTVTAELLTDIITDYTDELKSTVAQEYFRIRVSNGVGAKEINVFPDAFAITVMGIVSLLEHYKEDGKGFCSFLKDLS